MNFFCVALLKHTCIIYQPITDQQNRIRSARRKREVLDTIDEGPVLDHIVQEGNIISRWYIVVLFAGCQLPHNLQPSPIETAMFELCVARFTST